MNKTSHMPNPGSLDCQMPDVRHERKAVDSIYFEQGFRKSMKASTLGLQNKNQPIIVGVNTTTINQPTASLLSTKQAADAWGISRWRLYDLVKEGKIRPIVGMGKGWKFLLSDLMTLELPRL